jgi:predicted O-methyltransferase YrrM
VRGDSIRGWFTREEGAALARLAHDVSPETEIVEIGTFAGRSTAYLAEGAAAGGGAHITSLDDWSPAALPGGVDQAAADDVLAEYLREVDRKQVTFLRARSTQIAPFWLKPIGLCFLDATHLYEDTIRDIAEWGRHVIQGGPMAFHDYHHDHPGVVQATDEAVASGDWGHDTLTGSLRVLRRLR